MVSIVRRVRRAAWIVVAVGVVGLGACISPLEEEMPCPQCLAKSDSAGVWRYRIEALDPEDEKSGRCLAERTTGTVRFQITEDYLFAWLLTEPLTVEGCSGYQLLDCGALIIGAWKVRHFDKRTYCPDRTGEWISIIEENGSCYHWYERRYIQVDWSFNLGIHNEVERLTDGVIEVEPIHHDAPSPNDALFPEIDLGAASRAKRLSVSSVGLARLSTCTDPD